MNTPIIECHELTKCYDPAGKIGGESPGNKKTEELFPLFSGILFPYKKAEFSLCRIAGGFQFSFGRNSFQSLLQCRLRNSSGPELFPDHSPAPAAGIEKLGRICSQQFVIEIASCAAQGNGFVDIFKTVPPAELEF